MERLGYGGSGYVVNDGSKAVKYFRSESGSIRLGDIDMWMSEVLVRKVLGNDIGLCSMLSYDPKAFTLSMPLYSYDLISFLRDRNRYSHCPGESRKEKLQTFLLESVVPQVCYQLQAMHQRGIVHQDLKPENLLLLSNPHKPHNWEVSISDFGAAMMTKGRIYNALTTPGYVPELEEEWKIDYRYDMYGLGRTLITVAEDRGVYPIHYTPIFADLVRSLTSDYRGIPSPLTLCKEIPPLPKKKRNRKRLAFWLKLSMSDKYTAEVCQAVSDLLYHAPLKILCINGIEVKSPELMAFVDLFLQLLEDEEALELIRSSLATLYRA